MNEFLVHQNASGFLEIESHNTWQMALLEQGIILYESAQILLPLSFLKILILKGAYNNELS